MAIFNFVKQAGQMMSEGLEKAAAAATAASEADIKAKIEASSLSPKDLAVKKVDDETVKVYAVVASAEEKEELILLVGNTPGVAKVEDAIKIRPEGGAEVAAPAPKFYTVKSGDTLSDIAQSQLGDSGRYMEIFNANRNTLSNPDAIDVGQTLRIPQ
ncbi:MAG: LysM peptidoglycan-binding domain-containing protein [Candidatus Eremiobacteraeota bacterium]|nr:LysM peptidoglycan-binding domain-containing protein [Candidatus Eremiobacteraeota bacterium]